jgi:hypothetical protein
MEFGSRSSLWDAKRDALALKDQAQLHSRVRTARLYTEERGTNGNAEPHSDLLPNSPTDMGGLEALPSEALEKGFPR